MIASSPPAPDVVTSLVIKVPDNPSKIHTLDLQPWLGKGIDPWVSACASQLQAFLVSKEIQPTTVIAYWRNGLSKFFLFLVFSGNKVEPQTLKPEHIQQFICWLKEQGTKYASQKNFYTTTKAVLVALMRRGVIPNHEDLFPANPFPGSNSTTKGATPLSPGERERLVKALRDDIVAIHKETFQGLGRDALVAYLLAIAIRTGANPTPLLEASRDCLRPHPFMPNMMMLSLFKRRGNATKLTSLRFSREEDGSLAIPIDGVALIRTARRITEPLVAAAKPQHRVRLWLFRDGRVKNTGRVTALTTGSLGVGIAELIARHNLRDDNGEPLRLNLSRIRKTLEQRYWMLSGGDMIATAALMGHSPKVADTHYLACTHQMRENATFVGEALPDIYRDGAAQQKSSPILPSKSPTGRCKDPYKGDKAPKDGTPCDNFFSCFSCASYAIVGSPDDLHRLFSFYWFLEREINHAKSNDWREEFRHTMNLIDRFTADKFDANLVATTKERARLEPLTFWASYTLSSPG